MAKIEQFLKGIKMTGADGKEIEKDGRKTTQYIPWERQATEDDILSSMDYGDRLIIVTKDGKKHTVSKKAEEKK